MKHNTQSKIAISYWYYQRILKTPPIVPKSEYSIDNIEEATSMMSNIQYTNSLLRIGSVSAVRGSSIEILVDADKNEPSLIHEGEIIQNVTVGSFIIIHRGYRRLVAQVQEEFFGRKP